jgi:hypothetical protein
MVRRKEKQRVGLVLEAAGFPFSRGRIVVASVVNCVRSCPVNKACISVGGDPAGAGAAFSAPLQIDSIKRRPTRLILSLYLI